MSVDPLGTPRWTGPGKGRGTDPSEPRLGDRTKSGTFTGQPTSHLPGHVLSLRWFPRRQRTCRSEDAEGLDLRNVSGPKRLGRRVTSKPLRVLNEVSSHSLIPPSPWYVHPLIDVRTNGTTTFGHGDVGPQTEISEDRRTTGDDVDQVSLLVNRGVPTVPSIVPLSSLFLL